MKSKKIKNPLIKRIPKELAGDWKKYLVVFLFLVLTIGFVSGMYVANESMLTAADEGITRYKQEDGHFELKEKADSSLIEAIESGEKADIPGQAEENTADGDNDDSEENGKSDDDLDSSKKTSVTVYENFFRNEDEDNDNDGKIDGTIRVYAKTDDINLACLLDGDFPQNENEIAVDRMHADNAGMKVGDKISVSGKEFKITGLIAYVNYSTLHEKKTDLIFDAIKFDVAMVTQEGFDRLDKSIHYSYAWKYDHAPADDIEEKEQSDNFMEAMVTQVMLAGNEVEDYTPKYGNPAINFATDDMGSDKAMGGMLLDILVVIIAFIFAVTISNTIANESSAIGTLRALGYTKGELVRHYLSMPVIVTLLAAIVGNILGYTVFKNVVVSMYYNSYSLPVYKTIWNPDAFLKTTVLPVVIMLVVNLIVIVRMMQHKPLQFLRHDMKKNKSKKAMRLPRWNFMSRFRLRIMFQNKANYLILFVGILFIMEMLAMAVGMPDTLDYYKSNTDGMMFAKYQYVLKSYVDEEGNIVSTGNKDAEKFDMTSLLKKSDALDEEVSIYGIADNSSYVKINDFDSLKKNEVYISDSFSQKYGLNEGDEVKLDAQYEKKTYTFKVKGIYDKSQSIAVFMPIDKFADIFDLKDDQFSGFLSDTKIKDIDENNIATTITIHDITKMADQLDHSMGSYMSYFQVLCILLAAVMIYLLTKLIIEKNETAISMTKILGYENKEIASLYLVSTSIVVVLADLISVVIGTLVMKVAWKMMLFSYSGWFAFKVKPLGYVKMFAFVLIGYLIVMVFDFRRIKKIPMDQALKNVE
ncbi:MAG: FtsX-like permease family protein [Agathobacter sp.]|nr:FtsX-like permease family protein [Agathobacter sp.]